MAYGEVTGATAYELERMREEHKDSPLYKNHGVPFEVSYCLTRIGKQPSDYEGPERRCKRRALRRDPDHYEEEKKYCEAAYAPSCRFHGGDNALGGEKSKHHLEDPRTAGITHGHYAKDEHLMMDFDKHEQELYDQIVERWPEIYNWPAKDEDPARYRLLRRVAVNEVRALREEGILHEEGETISEPVFEDGIQVGEKEVENPIAREYRLLMKEVTNQLSELGLTPKSRQRMDTLEAEEEKKDAVSEIASKALQGDDTPEYDPKEFNE